jgi:hypothetical protein
MRLTHDLTLTSHTIIKLWTSAEVTLLRDFVNTYVMKNMAMNWIRDEKQSREKNLANLASHSETCALTQSILCSFLLTSITDPFYCLLYFSLCIYLRCFTFLVYLRNSRAPERLRSVICLHLTNKISLQRQQSVRIIFKHCWMVFHRHQHDISCSILAAPRSGKLETQGSVSCMGREFSLLHSG